MKNLGVIIKVPISQKAIYKVAIVFVDNIDLVLGGSNANMKMQHSIDIHNNLCIATGRYIEHSKMIYYSWQ